MRKFLIGAVLGAAAVAGLGAFVTHTVAGTESTTALDAHDTVTVDGHKALAGGIVAGRTQSKYHPLPWVGTVVTGVTCPTGLKAVAGANVTCTGEGSDGKTVDIPVTVVKATESSVTWTFER